MSTNRALAVLLGLVALAVLAQAALAGLFLAGVPGARLGHMIVGWLLPWSAIVPAVMAVVAHSNRRVSRGVMIGAVLLPMLLFVQEALGHMPFAASTAVHVPYGVGLFAGTVLLAAASTRPPTAAPRPEEVPPPGASPAPGSGTPPTPNPGG
ncbi:hypothetical protein ER308_10575 [Egibacter rhizosphaerae]|uniref:Uncharacterized protein n=1 Tax=Egibacter rhizosphaerae TaxID=1670831 RepID=A0A411YFK6_9ACTN|nr:hypothetical protein [Egibacter rhizosphaerae]QBI19959.1 hypothetical protein ER308_10575 [Egibacter rhizosphaerae]